MWNEKNNIKGTKIKKKNTSLLGLKKRPKLKKHKFIEIKHEKNYRD